MSQRAGPLALHGPVFTSPSSPPAPWSGHPDARASADALHQLLALPFNDDEDAGVISELTELATSTPTAAAFLITYLVSRGRFVEALSEHKRLDAMGTGRSMADMEVGWAARYPRRRPAGRTLKARCDHQHT